MPAKYRVEIARSAERDIQEIWAYIAADNPAKATEFIAELERDVAALERFPFRCPIIPENEILGTEYRHLLFGPYRTIFRIGRNVVFVLRVIHGARLLDSSVFESAEQVR